ncbi:MAG: hypothetical protein R3273_11905 [Pseudidiomarina maritima]|nr:hypothetical protein [Pseudidiomarina maritima]
MRSRYRVFECEESEEVEAALKDLISDISARVIPIQNEEGKPWQIIRFEIWEDSGRIIAFPAMADMDARTDIAGAQISCTELARFVEYLDSSDLSDEAHEQELLEIVDSVALQVSDLAAEHGEFLFRVYDQDGKPIQALNKLL